MNLAAPAMDEHLLKFVSTFIFSLAVVGFSAMDPNDVKILNPFKKALDNPELLLWLEDGGDPCRTAHWKYVVCKVNRVSQIQAKNLSLTGFLPQNFNQLSMIVNIGLRNNKPNGPLSSFSGSSDLQYVHLDCNDFDSIPVDFFDGLMSLEALELDYNNLNATPGWQFPL